MAEFQSLERNQSISVRIAEQVVGRIQSGEFPLGTRLPSETELARQFGVSRPSVREALGALQFVGYIDSVRGSGSRVISVTPHIVSPGTPVQVTPREVLRFFEARLLLEPQVAAVAARDPDLDKLAEAEELIEAMEMVVHEPTLHGETDLRVHRALAEVCRNSFMTEPVVRLLDVLVSPPLRPTRDQAWADRELPPIWHGQHRETVQAIRDRDALGAAESTWQHLTSSARNALTVVQRDPSVEERAIEDFAALLDDGPYASATILTSRPPRPGGGEARVRSVKD
ncbi:MAG: FadR/GntR family transcriptional regulator [Ornithinimicrobium sp.]|uniref:FadR/GntR family transcriptional regulator n=1 Tax=Ornithinimicrobium sp. TaxID=1977084 RepID=UPI003D9B0519